MIDTFQDALANIRSQQSVFENLDERAVEIGVVLPLLRRVGWNTENVSEVYPQRKQSDGKVDYALRIDGESRILIEVKTWGPILNEDGERQLAEYCRPAKPSLAVLTSGRYWRLYLPPTKGKSAPLRRFLELDIVTCQASDAENAFERFLSYDGMSDVISTVAQARKLYSEARAHERVEKQLAEAWNEIATDENALQGLLLQLAKNKSIPAGRKNVADFLKSHGLQGSLVNNTSMDKPKTKPASFALRTSPAGENMGRRQVSSKGWNALLEDICKLMQQRHPESLRKVMLSMPDRFAETMDAKFDTPVGDMGVFFRKGGSSEIRETCYTMLSRLGYPKDSLVIKDSRGDDL